MSERKHWNNHFCMRYWVWLFSFFFLRFSVEIKLFCFFLPFVEREWKNNCVASIVWERVLSVSFFKKKKRVWCDFLRKVNLCTTNNGKEQHVKSQTLHITTLLNNKLINSPVNGCFATKSFKNSTICYSITIFLHVISRPIVSHK